MAQTFPGDAGLDQHPGGKFGWLMDMSGYIALAAGYLLAVLTAWDFTLAGLLVLTALNLVVVWVFRRMTSDEECTPLRVILLAAALIATTVLTELMPLFGMGFDWLLPVVVIAVLSVSNPWRQALAYFLIVWGLSAVALFIIDGRLTADQLSMPSAFIFAFVFGAAIRYNAEQRSRAEQLIARLEEAQEQLRSQAREMEDLAVARERNRMAREIHDTLGHYLTILAVQLETALKLHDKADPRLRDELVEARRVAAECLAEVRRSVAALRPADPTAASFTAALEGLKDEFEAAEPETDVALDVEGPAQELPPELRVALYRAVQESLTNIRKHAQATKVLVRLRVDAAQAELAVLDNGLGAQSTSDGHEPGFGLLGMRERIALLGGTASSKPEPGRGWRVEVHVPLAGAGIQNGASATRSGAHDASRGVAVASGAEA